jgi:hypothetical protein
MSLKSIAKPPCEQAQCSEYTPHCTKRQKGTGPFVSSANAVFNVAIIHRNVRSSVIWHRLIVQSSPARENHPRAGAVPIPARPPPCRNAQETRSPANSYRRLRPCTGNQQITRKPVGRATVNTLAPGLRSLQHLLGRRPRCPSAVAARRSRWRRKLKPVARSGRPAVGSVRLGPPLFAAVPETGHNSVPTWSGFAGP